jgi:filamentous hemagglutinin family protein
LGASIMSKWSSLKRNKRPHARTARSLIRPDACACCGRMTLLATLLGLCASAHGGAVTDGSLGSKTSLSGNFTVGAGLGKQLGGNLFHSFSTFSIDLGESATFTGPRSVQNVFVRVSGRQSSNIDGPLNCTIANADVYFINPNGVVFGPGASLNVQGSFAVTTADYLRLGAAGHFAATSAPRSSVLSSAPPAAFGFLGAHARARISVQGQGAVPILSPAAGKSLLVVGGSISIVDGELATSGAGAATYASVASSGEVNLPARPSQWTSVLSDAWDRLAPGPRSAPMVR